MSVLTPAGLAFAICVALVAGTVKGIVGFAMPMILISGLSTLLAPDIALAALILPTLVTNVFQALAQGMSAAWQAIKRFRLFLVVGMVVMIGSAQLVAILPQRALYLMIGLPVSGFALLQLTGWKASLAAPSARIEAAVGAFAGFIGGMSGIWGPPTVAYLTAINTPKADQMRIQGVIYGLGAIVLLAAHIQSGVVRAQTVPLSALMVVPAMIGMILGGWVQHRINQDRFKQVTLCVLLIAGLNLVRRGLLG